MADTSQSESGSDYGSDVLTDFESEMFRSTTSKITNKTLSVARRTRNVKTRRGEVSKVPKQNLSRRIQLAKNAPQGKQRSIFRELYLHKIGTQHASAPLERITVFFQAPPPRQLRTNKSSHNSPNGSDFERLNNLKAAQEEDDESKSDSSISNRDTNKRDYSTAIGSYASFAYLKRRQKRSDIHIQSRLTNYRGALYFQCNYCPQKYKESGGTKNMRDYLIKVHGWDGMTSVQLKKKRENQEIKAILERSAPGEAKRLQAKRAELLKDFINRKTLEYLYIHYTVNANAPFS